MNRLVGRALTERLSLEESALVAVVLLIGGTIYCQLYCLIAFQAMAGMLMPLSLSIGRSAVETVPAFAAFELSKRISTDSPSLRQSMAVATILFLATAATVALILLAGPLFAGSGMPLRLIVADRMPGLTLTVLAIAFARYLGKSRMDSGAPAAFEKPMAALLVPREIDWVHAAGNYVEVHSRGRVTLLRLSLREAATRLSGHEFVQIHRSVLVNRCRIEAFEPGHRPNYVRLFDGTVLRMGDTHRTRIFDGRPVPSSQSIGA